MDHTALHHPAVRFLDELTAKRLDPVVSKAMVFDTLLDLRLLVGDHPALVAIVDQRLCDVPGATMCPGAWWKEALQTLRLVVGDAVCPEAVS